MLIAFKLKLVLVAAVALALAGAAGSGVAAHRTGLPDPALRPLGRGRLARLRVHIASPAISPATGRPVDSAASYACGSTQPLAIMKHQVSAAEYQRCVDDGACRRSTAA